MAFAYHIRELTAETTVPEFVAQFVHVEKFLPACRQCPRYNTRWTCPPFDFDPMDVWGGYTGLRLYARILDADGAGQPMDDATEALLREKRLYREKLRQWEQAAPGSQMLRPVPGLREVAGQALPFSGASALLHRGPGRRCGGVPAALFPHAGAVGQGRRRAGLSGAGGRPADEVKSGAEKKSKSFDLLFF